MKAIKKSLLKTYIATSSICAIWLMASWFEILGKNMIPNPGYSPLNFFAIFTELATRFGG